GSLVSGGLQIACAARTAHTTFSEAETSGCLLAWLFSRQARGTPLQTSQLSAEVRRHLITPDQYPCRCIRHSSTVAPLSPYTYQVYRCGRFLRPLKPVPHCLISAISDLCSPAQAA